MGDDRYYFVKIRPSREEHEKAEAEKQYQFMNLARIRINEEIANLEVDEHHINQKIMKFSLLDEEIHYRRQEIQYTRRHIKILENSVPCFPGKDKHVLPIDSVPRTTGFFHLPGEDGLIKPDQKRCQKKLLKKGRMDMEYLQQIQEQLLGSKKCIGMATQELDTMIKSMMQGIKHGNKKHADEMKIYQEISNFMETKEIYNEPKTDPYSDHLYTRERKSKREIDYGDHRMSKRVIDWMRCLEHMINIRLDDIEQIKRKQIGRKARVARLKAELESVRKNTSFLKKELKNVNKNRLESYKRVQDLGEPKKNEELNSSYNEYQSLMIYAEKLARKGDVVELKQVCYTQVEEFMKRSNYSKAFQEDYEKRKLVRQG